jgi:hypothetical protein
VLTHHDQAPRSISGESDRAAEHCAGANSHTASAPPPTAFRLRWQTVDRGTLADGRECLLDVYEASILWDGKVRDIMISEADASPLIGMGLLRGHELNIQARPGGKVTIKRLR